MSSCPNKSTDEGIIPSTPAELPMKVPRLVTEFKMLLIRSLAFDTASGRLEPSRKPHKPPMARPDNKIRASRLEIGRGNGDGITRRNHSMEEKVYTPLKYVVPVP